jgi:hypothetical protein
VADIAMCINKECPSKAYCYRYTAKANEYRQAYMDFKPATGQDKCEDFTPNGGRP